MMGVEKRRSGGDELVVWVVGVRGVEKCLVWVGGVKETHFT
jgi:hypothetical protein